jgi:DNA-binding transcriptional LysR family regulator
MPALLVATAGRPVRTRAIQPATSPRRISAVHRPDTPRMPAIRTTVDALRMASRAWHAALSVTPDAHASA